MLGCKPTVPLLHLYARKDSLIGGYSINTVILAGGRGIRLQTFTLVVPKPLVPGGDMPVIELIIQRLRRSGLEAS